MWLHDKNETLPDSMTELRQKLSWRGAWVWECLAKAPRQLCANCSKPSCRSLSPTDDDGPRRNIFYCNDCYGIVVKQSSTQPPHSLCASHHGARAGVEGVDAYTVALDQTDINQLMSGPDDPLIPEDLVDMGEVQGLTGGSKHCLLPFSQETAGNMQQLGQYLVCLLKHHGGQQKMTVLAKDLNIRAYLRGMNFGAEYSGGGDRARLQKFIFETRNQADACFVEHGEYVMLKEFAANSDSAQPATILAERSVASRGHLAVCLLQRQREPCQVLLRENPALRPRCQNAR